MITPRTLKGFRDYLPESMIPRCQLIETASKVYRSYGFCPIDTPALEYFEILNGKGSDETDKQMYRFTDNGGREVGMRFDLTVPLARFVAQHYPNDLILPFKRYHIASVWRGENTQAGRYREFMQCDFDTIGTLNVSADIESTLVIYDLMRAIGFENFTIHLNNRKVLNGILERYELQDKSVPILRSLDKLAKIGTSGVMAELKEVAGVTDEQGQKLLDLASLSGSNDAVLSTLETMTEGIEKACSGLEDLWAILAAAAAVGIPEKNLKLDISIVRGLDYYTGTIWETILDDLPSVGSVCSGGRYDNLAGLFTKQLLPGIGASLGLDRLLAAMEQLQLIPVVRTPAPVLIPYFDAEHYLDYVKIASSLRAAGIGVEIYPEPKKLKNQLQYADKKGFRFIVLAGSDELSQGVCQLKNTQTHTQIVVPLADLPTELTKLLAQ